MYTDSKLWNTQKHSQDQLRCDDVLIILLTVFISKTYVSPLRSSSSSSSSCSKHYVLVCYCTTNQNLCLFLSFQKHLLHLAWYFSIIWGILTKLTVSTCSSQFILYYCFIIGDICNSFIISSCLLPPEEFNLLSLSWGNDNLTSSILYLIFIIISPDLYTYYQKSNKN